MGNHRYHKQYRNHANPRNHGNHQTNGDHTKKQKDHINRGNHRNHKQYRNHGNYKTSRKSLKSLTSREITYITKKKTHIHHKHTKNGTLPKRIGITKITEITQIIENHRNRGNH